MARQLIGICLCFGAALASACQPAPAAPTARPDAEPIRTLPPTQTPPPTRDLNRTPPALPEIFHPAQLNPLDTPRAYIEDACRYLGARWDPDNAAPGTVVMIVMLHSINRGAVPKHSTDAITVLELIKMGAELHEQNFQGIDAGQLADFLEHNAKIPARSVVIVQDGRRFAENFDRNFRPFRDDWGWPVVNAWEMIGEAPQSLWDENLALEQEGWVDHQVQGPQVTAGTETLSDQYLADLFTEPYDEFRDRFHKNPVAIVWPGGFGPRTIAAARQTGYRLGFTYNARGPVMFNWVPQAELKDRERPAYAPEAAAGDPLMTLPRYWPDQVHDALDSVRQIGNAAAAFAEQNKAVELEYYDIVCAPDYGPIQ
jgi:hypothetical protein